jgi:hypothetical protein
LEENGLYKLEMKFKGTGPMEEEEEQQQQQQQDRKSNRHDI